MSDFAQSVKQQADIVRVLGEYIRLRKTGAQNYSGLCPFHKEKSPSFSVHAVRQFYHCFGCGQSGDVFSFVQKLENVAFPEAVRIVAEKCGIPLPRREYSSPEEARESRLRGRLLELEEAAAAWFEQQLRTPEGALAREYLRGRGVTDEAIARFRIGYAPDSFQALRERLAPLADAEALRLSGLFAWKEREDGRGGVEAGPLYARFRRRIMFPIAAESGRVIAFTARALDSGEKAGPKYLNSPETPLYSKGQVLFNLDKARTAIRQNEFALLVEGQMDCISVYMRGIQNVIATSGTAFTEQQAALLRRHTHQVVVNFDPDAAGANAAEKSIALLTEEGFSIKIVTLEDGLDPDRYIRERGVEAYVAALRGARWQADYLIGRARQLFPGHGADAKVRALNFLLPHIRRMPNALEREQFAADAAQKLGIDSALLREQLRQAALQRRSSVAARPAALSELDRVLLRALCLPEADPAGQPVRRALGEHPEWFQPLASSPLLAALAARQGRDPLEALPAPEQRALLAPVLLAEAGPVTAADAAAALEALSHRAMERRQRELRAAIAEAERRGDPEATAGLVREKLEIDRRLRDAPASEVGPAT